jgi:hypothetical protein
VTRDDGLRRLLEGLSREMPPDIPAEALFRRLAWRRLRIVALCLGLLGVLLLALLLLRPEPEPPVNLHLRVVNVGEPIEAPTQDPPEVNLP